MKGNAPLKICWGHKRIAPFAVCSGRFLRRWNNSSSKGNVNFNLCLFPCICADIPNDYRANICEWMSGDCPKNTEKPIAHSKIEFLAFAAAGQQHFRRAPRPIDTPEINNWPEHMKLISNFWMICIFRSAIENGGICMNVNCKLKSFRQSKYYNFARAWSSNAAPAPWVLAERKKIHRKRTEKSHFSLLILLSRLSCAASSSSLPLLLSSLNDIP